MAKLHPDRFMTKMEQEIEFSQASQSHHLIAATTPLQLPQTEASILLPFSPAFSFRFPRHP